MPDVSTSADKFSAAMQAAAAGGDKLKIIGEYTFVCRDAEGNELWREVVPNLLTQIGKALLLDQGLAGSAYTAVEYMGLISSTSFSAVSGGDTMTSHTGWLEAGSANAPTYSGNRLTTAWSAATTSGASAYSATKALSAGLTFTFTGSGTVQGAFLVGGSGASATIGNTGGTLYSAGTFSTPQPVVSTNTLTVSYSTTLT